MASFQVSCIEKRGDHFEPHERVTRIGGKDPYGVRWEKTEAEIIQAIKSGTDEFYISSDSRRVNLMVASRNGREYLKTTNDGYSPDNLLNLPEC